MKTILVLLFSLSVGVGQTKIDSLTIKGTNGEFVILEKPTWHYQWGTIDHEGKVEFSDNFWLAFAAKWREYEAECRKDSVLYITWEPHIQGERAYGNYRRERWVYRNSPTFPGFILWLERKK